MARGNKSPTAPAGRGSEAANSVPPSTNNSTGPSTSKASSGSPRPSTTHSAPAAPARPASRAQSSVRSASSSPADPMPSSRPWGQPPSKAGGTGASTTAASSAIGEAADDETRRRHEARRAELSQLSLVVCQQPERARLCSFKEENETIDRRPVDPPPVIELVSQAGDAPELLESTTFMVRASLVAPEKSTEQIQPHESPYPTVKTPTGADATAGETIQTPERLRHLDGKPGALCIFAKLSVRVPGVYRLKFTLYETANDGMTEITHTVSEPFEVFSPKLFKGMHESTPLTRHLATQGLKVKLRTDSTSGKGPSRRRVSTAYHGNNSSEPPPGEVMSTPHSAHGHSHSGPQHSRYSRGHQPLSTTAPSRSLVWQAHHAAAYPDYDVGHRRSPAPEQEAVRKVRRLGRDDGMFALTDISSRLDFSFTSPLPSSDLSAFSLGHSPGMRASARPGSDSGPPPYGRRDRDGRREYGPGDDGLPTLPIPSWQSSTYRPPADFALPRLPRIVPSPAPPPRESSPGPGPIRHSRHEHPHEHHHPYAHAHAHHRMHDSPHSPRPDEVYHAHHAAHHSRPHTHPHASMPQYNAHSSTPPLVLPPIRSRSPLRRPYDRGDRHA